MDTTRGGRLAQLARWGTRVPRWVSAVTLALLLAGSWSVVYATGGTWTAWPHVFYLPVLLGAIAFGPVGGLVVGIVAAVLCGPAMPLDVASAESQSLANWVTRGGFFAGVGMLTGATISALRWSYEQGLTDLLQHEVDRAISNRSVAVDLREHLHDVLACRRFHMVFQPIYSLGDGALVAVEALARFDVEPYRPPNLWFDQAAAVGLGVELELGAIDAALAASRPHVRPGVAVTVNASPMTLADARLLDVIDRYDDLQLIVEVTEHAVVDDYQHLEDALGDLRERGVQLAVDDAGAGFASLRHIVRLAPEFIKLDHSLTRDVLADPIRRALASSLVAFAQQAGARLVAEGIETSADLLAWRELGAHAAQGYFLARPGPLPATSPCQCIPHEAPDHDTRPHHLSNVR